MYARSYFAILTTCISRGLNGLAIPPKCTPGYTKMITFSSFEPNCDFRDLSLQIEEIALVTDKVTKKRRGFCFVTYISEESVDKCTEQTFHNVEDTQVSHSTICTCF